MKKQNTINKLAFNKAAVTELNDNQLNKINGLSFSLPASSFKCIVGPLADYIETL
jgi:hypothetical protein